MLAGAKQQGATPMRRKALGDITNSRSASKQSGGGGSSQKGAKVASRAAATPLSQPIFPSHVEEVDTMTRFATEDAFSDPALDIDALLSASGPVEPFAKPVAAVSHAPVEFEAEAPAMDVEEEEGFADMDFDDESPFGAVGDDIAFSDDE